MSPPKKKIRSQPPDVVVVVGSGDEKKEFECYKVVLSFASDYLDTMLSTNMAERETSRIEFPDKDPEEWEMVYKFMDPCQYRDAIVNESNAMRLLPWFHEFGMEKFVEECSHFINEECKRLTKVDGGLTTEFEACWVKCKDLRGKKETFDSIISLLQVASTYNLHTTESNCVKFLDFVMNEEQHRGKWDLFNLETFKALVPLVLPIERPPESTFSKLKSGGKSPSLWTAIENNVLWTNDITPLSINLINNSENLSFLLDVYMKKNAQMRRLGREKGDADENAMNVRKSAKAVVQTLINEIPDELYKSLPHSSKLKNDQIDSLASDRLKTLYYQKLKNNYDEELKLLQVTVPESYSNDAKGAILRLVSPGSYISKAALLTKMEEKGFSEKDTDIAIEFLLGETKLIQRGDKFLHPFW